jgi:hypothetical protein
LGRRGMNVPAEAGAWVSDAKKSNGLLFSELDVLLRTLDRFFIIENLTTGKEDLTAKNFYEELSTARDTILRVLGIFEVVIPDSNKNAYWFQRFAETKLLSASQRDEFRETLYRQDTPEKSIYLLYDFFINLKGVFSDLMRNGKISYTGFTNIGYIISKEIRKNVYFTPFGRDANPEFDVIDSSMISHIVGTMEDREMKKNISLIFISLFRFLKFLRVVDVPSQRGVLLNTSLAVLIMVRSEIQLFQDLLELASKAAGDKSLRTVLDSLSYQFSLEARRVFQVELQDIHRQSVTSLLRGRIENCHGILRNLVEQSIMQLVQAFNPSATGEDIFPDLGTRLQESLRLREDLVALHRLIADLDAGVESPDCARLFESLWNYMVYFESFTFGLLRSEDYEEFVFFFNEMRAAKRETMQGSELQRVVERIRHFKIFVETTVDNVENRSELSNIPVDMERVEGLIRQYA